MAQNLKKSSKTGVSQKTPLLTNNDLKIKGSKIGMRELSIRNVGRSSNFSDFSGKIVIFGKKWVGPENAEEKMVIYGKKLVGGYQIPPGTNLRHTLRKYLPDPP